MRRLARIEAQNCPKLAHRDALTVRARRSEAHFSCAAGAPEHKIIDASKKGARRAIAGPPLSVIAGQRNGIPRLITTPRRA